MPRASPMTDSGKARSCPFSVKRSSGSRPFFTRNMAMSPTTFDEGVTLTMSPKSRFTFRYMSLHSSHWSRRPSPATCGL